jgi:hypothetical protein
MASSVVHANQVLGHRCGIKLNLAAGNSVTELVRVEKGTLDRVLTNIEEDDMIDIAARSRQKLAGHINVYVLYSIREQPRPGYIPETFGVVPKTGLLANRRIDAMRRSVFLAAVRWNRKTLAHEVCHYLGHSGHIQNVQCPAPSRDEANRNLMCVGAIEGLAQDELRWSQVWLLLWKVVQ